MCLSRVPWRARPGRFQETGEIPAKGWLCELSRVEPVEEQVAILMASTSRGFAVRALGGNRPV